MSRINQSGFSIVELGVIVVVILVLGFVGYGVYSRQQTSTSNSTSNSATATDKATDVPAAPYVSTSSDLDKAVKTLDQTDPSGSNNSDSQQIDNQMSSF